MASIVAIVGQTASGKTSLAVDIAKKFNGEIICADSRTIYKGMDIGTAKPTNYQREQVAHHLLDIINPDERYSVAQFKIDANKAINIICSRGKVPIIVGGSGLYVDSVLYDFDLSSKDVRKVDKTLSVDNLQSLAINLGLKPSEQTMQNKQHLVRFIERDGVSGGRKSTKALVIGLKVDKDILNQRIIDRVELMFKNGVVQEAKELIKKYGKNIPALQTPGYRPVIEYINRKISLDQAKQDFIKNDKNLAKRQQTWFKKNKDIVWVDNNFQAEQLINDYLVQ